MLDARRDPSRHTHFPESDWPPRMLLSFAHAPPHPLNAVRFLPSLGLLLTALGVSLIFIGAGLNGLASSSIIPENGAIRNGADTSFSTSTTRMEGLRPAQIEHQQPEVETSGGNLGPSHAASDRQVAKWERGNRAESAQLALTVRATDERRLKSGSWCPPCASKNITVDPDRFPGPDVFAAALFGPPDRQPNAAAIETAIRTRGDAGGYLEPKAAAEWTARWYRAVTDPGDDVRLYLVMSASARWSARWYAAIAVWDESSGYGAVESSRGDS
jgi:hypothetical protein